jgi:hypothetical protein
LSIVLASLGVAGGVLLARAIGRRVFWKARPAEDTSPGESKEAAGEGAADSSLPGFPCQLGDVILAHHGDEAWLAGALVFRERQPMAVLFIAPDAGGDRAVYVRPAPHASLVWMSPLAADALVIGREPPSSIEHQQERFDRTRRLPYRVERLGTGAPDVGEDVIVAEYSAATGDRLLVVVGSAGARSWRGRPLDEGTYEVLPGKDTTGVR